MKLTPWTNWGTRAAQVLWSGGDDCEPLLYDRAGGMGPKIRDAFPLRSNRSECRHRVHHHRRGPTMRDSLEDRLEML